jgi:hypothetical protein
MTLEEHIVRLQKELDGLIRENIDCGDPDWLTHLRIASLHLGWSLKDLKG